MYGGAGAGPIGFADAFTAPTAGEWHHIAVSKIGSEVFFYFDGLPDGQFKADASSKFGNYTTALVGNYSIEWIRKMATDGSGRPFFAYIAQLASSSRHSSYASNNPECAGGHDTGRPCCSPHLAS